MQDGQIRHLAAGQHWPQTKFWEYDAYQNGGFWGTASGWVLPVIGRNSTAVAKQLVRDAVEDARRNGLNEWHNNDFMSGYSGPPQGEYAGLGAFASYPVMGAWYGGAMNYGPNIGSVYRAASLLLQDTPTPPPPTPPTPPAPPAPPTSSCNLTGSWGFYSAAANTSEASEYTL